MLSFMAVIPMAAGCRTQTTPAACAASPIVLEAGQMVRRGSIDFVRGWALGRRVAAERGQPCLVFFTTEWCAFCRQMEDTTFKDPVVVELAKEFVCVLVDGDEEREICARRQVSGFPTVELISPAGTPLGRLVGWQSAPGLVNSLQAALGRYALLEKDGTMREAVKLGAPSGRG
jgi:thiol:disulfide interchange protein